MNKCAAAKEKVAAADETFRELKRQSLPMAIEPAWKRRRFDFVEVRRSFPLQARMLSTPLVATGKLGGPI